ncbi:hypothetical protein NQ176_g9537 [Zarea fungicola]|uniref:Uncharacterized protein n=1 Tax=Zarea fungicola TaxID=93591 RepID=A0ACC1MM34_9HYPO|nr:hypothetical protein NQ176_g9537 [Lecanicillium fungicola]
MITSPLAQLAVMESLTDEEILSRYAYTPERIKTGMVRVSNVSTLPLPRQWQTLHSLGQLDSLPTEVLQLMLDHLDFLSLARLARTARRGQELVASFPAYHLVRRHASETLAALSAMSILYLHSASLLREALHSSECSCCGNFGAFLFLLSCERCCFQCISTKPALWVLPRPDASKCFNLSAKQLKALPSARSLSGKYCVLFDISRTRPLHLVSVRAAKKLALQVHGSEAAVTSHVPSARLSNNLQGNLALLQHTQLDFSKHDPFLGSNPGNDWYNGMATIRFPHLPVAHEDSDWGSWCRGCKLVWRKADHNELDTAQMSQIVPQDRHPGAFCFRFALREWPRADFSGHARSCYGVQVLEERFRDGTLGALDDFL